jgi:biotin synthase
MDKLRMSLAAAITLGFKPGRFYRDARLYCINLLMDYPTGCEANCSYCGLSSGRETPEGEQTFIRIEWPRYRVERIIDRIESRVERVKRICLAMVTHPRAPIDLTGLIRRFKERLNIPISLLVTPTYLEESHLREYKSCGADRFTVAFDAAHRSAFEEHRGSGVGSFLDWDKYWEIFDRAVPIFGKRKVGGHLIVGLGETEKEMAGAFQRIRERGGETHLFSFYPESHSAMEGKKPPPMGQYRRMQLARYIIDRGLGAFQDFRFDSRDRLIDYGMDSAPLMQIIQSGLPFMTSGCPGEDGAVACNRPFANSRPGPHLRNYPFTPHKMDLARIERQLWK